MNKTNNLFIRTLVAAPIVVLIAGNLLSEQYNDFLIFILIIAAFLSCFALYKYLHKAIAIALFPAFVCVFSGINAFYMFCKYGVGTVATFWEAFCSFIAGVFLLFILIPWFSTDE